MRVGVSSVPTPNEQVRFLLNVQRLLGEGLFTATYKYALLLALADLAVEVGEDTGAPVTISAAQIAEKFIEYYWRQAMPYPAAAGNGKGLLLRQNTDRQAAIVRLVARARERSAGSLCVLQRDLAAWRRLVREVAQIVKLMPLWKLQVVGGTVLDFVYENRKQGDTITLRSGVAFCLRQFHGLMTELVRGAWTRYIRQQNLGVLGQASDINEFLFGSERADLGPVREMLRDVQENRCFYCHDRLRDTADVDHFVPWVMYPVDLGHNFVLADKKCNLQKRDRLAAEEHLAAWLRRNHDIGGAMTHEFDRAGVRHSLEASIRVARWAYGHAQLVGGLTWKQADLLVPLTVGWDSLLGRTDVGM